MPVYAVFCTPSAGWVVGKSNTEQSYWNEHMRYIETLLLDEQVLLCGTYSDYSKILMVFEAEDETSVQLALKDDPLIQNKVTTVEQVIEWKLYFNPSDGINRLNGANRD